MKLYHDPISRSSRIVTFLLHDQDIPFDEEIVNLSAGEQRSEAFLALNANGEVPVLVDEGLVLAQSDAILRYLAAKLDLAVYPKEATARTRVDEAMAWFQTNFYTYHCVMLGYTYILPRYAALPTATIEAIREIGREGSTRCLHILDQHMIADRKFVCGDRITLADYIGAANVTLGAFAGVDLKPYANISRWLCSLESRNGWSRAYAGFEGALMALRANARRMTA